MSPLGGAMRRRCKPERVEGDQGEEPKNLQSEQGRRPRTTTAKGRETWEQSLKRTAGNRDVSATTKSVAIKDGATSRTDRPRPAKHADPTHTGAGSTPSTHAPKAYRSQ
jgi:hypothetical protein